MASLASAAPILQSMASAAVTPWSNDDEAIEYAKDPKEFTLERCRVFLDNMEVFHNWVVSATYYLPAFHILPGGQKFHYPQKTHDEALWQGKVGLLIAKGPTVFLDEEHVRFHGQNVQIGDWIQYDIHDGRQFTINRIHCRLLKDTQIIARIADPRLVY